MLDPMLIETDPSAFAAGFLYIVISAYVGAGVYCGRKVYVDAVERGLSHIWRWVLLACMFNHVGVVLYETITEKPRPLASFDRILWGTAKQTKDGYVDESWRKHRFAIIFLGSFSILLILGFVTIMIMALTGLRTG